MIVCGSPSALVRIWLFAGLALAMVGVRASAAQPAPPALTAPVNDFAGAIDAATTQQIEALSARLQQATGDVIVVATIKTFQPWGDLSSYAVKMFENGGRGIGQQGKDNGLLIVLALDDREVRAEVGYDLEGFVTDGFAGQVSRDVMLPFFREGNFGQGLLAGATRLAQRVAEGRNVDIGIAPVAAPRSQQSRGGRIPGGLWILLLIILLSMMGGGRGGRGMRRRGRWVSGVGAFGALGGFGGGRGSSGGFGGGGFGGFGGGRSGGGGGGASW